MKIHLQNCLMCRVLWKSIEDQDVFSEELELHPHVHTPPIDHLLPHFLLSSKVVAKLVDFLLSFLHPLSQEKKEKFLNFCVQVHKHYFLHHSPLYNCVKRQKKLKCT